jgi:hypothetical protein
MYGDDSRALSMTHNQEVQVQTRDPDGGNPTPKTRALTWIPRPSPLAARSMEQFPVGPRGDVWWKS